MTATAVDQQQTNRAATWCAVAVSADPLTTVVGIAAGAVEGHPLWAALIDHAGIAGFLTVRLLAGLLAVGLVTVAVQAGRLSVRVLHVLTVAFFVIAVWNLAVALIA